METYFRNTRFFVEVNGKQIGGKVAEYSHAKETFDREAARKRRKTATIILREIRYSTAGEILDDCELIKLTKIKKSH